MDDDDEDDDGDDGVRDEDDISISIALDKKLEASAATSENLKFVEEYERETERYLSQGVVAGVGELLERVEGSGSVCGEVAEEELGELEGGV